MGVPVSEILPVRFDEEMISTYVQLFAKCFPTSRKFSYAYLNWLYKLNPIGRAVGFDAWHGDVLTAHYLGVPMEVIIEGRKVRALLSLNTATHPDFQGRGLFTKLAERTYEAAAAQGFDAVFGVANANSTPGFVRKLGFQLVEPLVAKVGLGSLGIDLSGVEQKAQFRTTWMPAAFTWRCNNPCNLVTKFVHANQIQLFASTKIVGLPVYTELSSPVLANIETPARIARLSPLRLYLGLVPTGCNLSRFYVDIPLRFRPSPLNFIYKSLSGMSKQLVPGQLSFSFLDFDAF